MKGAINTVLRGLCLLTYAAALAHTAGWLPAGLMPRAPLMAGVLLAVHTAELPLAFKHLRRDHRPLALGLLLTWLYGLMHWWPLAHPQAAHPTDRRPAP
jgi:hypothetical protein